MTNGQNKRQRKKTTAAFARRRQSLRAYPNAVLCFRRPRMRSPPIRRAQRLQMLRVSILALCDDRASRSICFVRARRKRCSQSFDGQRALLLSFVDWKNLIPHVADHIHQVVHGLRLVEGDVVGRLRRAAPRQIQLSHRQPASFASCDNLNAFQIPLFTYKLADFAVRRLSRGRGREKEQRIADGCRCYTGTSTVGRASDEHQRRPERGTAGRTRAPCAAAALAGVGQTSGKLAQKLFSLCVCVCVTQH